MNRASLAAAALLALGAVAATQPRADAREEAYRANNRGVAYLEQYNHAEAAAEFRRALALDPSLQLAQINLAIALFYVPDLPASVEAARAARAGSPEAPQPLYIQGLIAKSDNRVDDAVDAFGRVLALDATDLGARVNLAQLHMQRREYDAAVELLRPAVASEPYHVTALYNLGVALTRAGKADEGGRVMAEFQKLREGGYGTTFSNNYLEQGRYAEAVASTGAEAELVSRATPDVRFGAGAAIEPAAVVSPATAAAPAGFALVDLDGDGDLDLVDAGGGAVRVFTNAGGVLADTTAKAGLAPAAKGAPVAVVAADYDNDTKVNLFVLGAGAHQLWRQGGGGRFEEATATAGFPAISGPHRAAAFADVDHDGDVDVVLAAAAAPAAHVLLRNNGNGTFTDVSAASGLAAVPPGALALVPTDYDNRRDLDLLLAGDGAGPRPPALLKNLRDGTFRDVGVEVGLPGAGAYRSVAAGDVNKDGFTDFYFGRAGAPGILALSDGRGRFRDADAGPAALDVSASQFVDVDNDGLLDLVAIAGGAMAIWRNLGRDWVDVTAAVGLAGAAGVPAPRALASGDVDADGDTDLVVKVASGGLRVLVNDGAHRRGALAVRLAGRVSNRSAIGSKIELRAGSLRQKVETASAWPAAAPADVLFGLGSRPAADVVRVLWPAGILQAEIPAAPATAAAAPAVQVLALTELDRKPSSCPYLFTWNGERFEFLTDFMGGGEMAYAPAPGTVNVPDPEEYTRIPARALEPRDGRYELRVTNELEEALFIDRLALVAVDHPGEVEVHPREGLVAPPFPSFELYAAQNPRAVPATDHAGRDVTDRVRDLDRRHVEGLPLEAIRGYARPHALTLALDPGAPPPGLLLLTGWTDYAFSSDNIAAAQAGLTLAPPALQARGADGTWRPVAAEVGIPVGRPQTVVVDLAGRLPPRTAALRIVTSMRIFWDQIRLADRVPVEPRVTRLDPSSAQLRWRGFSAETSPDGREPFGYDYARVSSRSPWKVLPGRYTREGAVEELVRRADDRFVVARSGDELALAFDAGALPPPPAGWSRTFLLHSIGYSKEMDRNSASPDQAAPLPFRAMSRYPYPATERYPDTPAHREYQRQWNTRVVGRELPPLELAAGPGR